MRKLPEFEGGNAKIAEGFLRHMKLKGKKEKTINGDMWQLASFLKYFDYKPADEITKEELEDFFIYRRENCRPATVHNNFIFTRTFYKWLLPDQWEDMFQDITVKAPKNRLPVEELLYDHDVKKLLMGCNKQRDRALLMLLWDSGGRVSELTGLNVGHFETDKYGAVIIVDGKTGMRRIRLIDSVPDVQLWLNQHPERDNPQAPLFVTDRLYDGEYRRLDRHTIANIIKGAADKVGFRKKIHAHAFRHGKLTDLAKKGFNEMELRIFAGWEDTSTMPATYLHLSGADVDKKLLQHHGIIEEKPEEEKTGQLKPRECPRCGNKNPADAKYCSHCSLVLDAKTAMNLKEDSIKAADAFTKQMQDPEFIAKVAQMMAQQMKT